MLEALPGRTAKVNTPWAEGVNAFQGPLTRAVLEAVGPAGTKLKVTALNDYWAEVPAEDFIKFDVISWRSRRMMPISRSATRDQSSSISIRSQFSLYNEGILADPYGR